MIKKRRRVDKKKRRCLFGAMKNTELDQSTENIAIIVEKPVVKKTKIERIVDIKKEETIDESLITEDPKTKSVSDDEESVAKKKERDVNKSTIEETENPKKELKSKTPKKTKQK